MARYERRGNNGLIFEIAAGSVAYICSIIPRVAQFLDTLGSVSSFRAWSRSRGSHPIFLSREAMWAKKLVSQLIDEENVAILEFGVAYGDATRWWLTRLKSPTLRYFGFDLFTGLPRAWRNMPAAAFDAGGNPPKIEDSRITWIQGDVAQTVLEFEFEMCSGRKLVIFDLDIFEPSLAVWKALQPQLRAGDLLYFDEAFDMDERLLVTAFILPTNNFNIVATSSLGLVLQVNR